MTPNARRRPAARIALLGLSVAFLSLGCAPKPATNTDAADTSLAEPVSPLLADLPAPARLAIQRQTSGTTLRKVQQDEFLGRTVFTADFTTADNLPGELQVTRDGRVLSRTVRQRDIPFNQAPERVQAALIAKTGGTVPPKLSVDDTRSRRVFTARVELAQVPNAFEFDETGSLIRETVDINRLQLPPVVVASLIRRFQGMSVTNIQEVRQGTAISYNIEGNLNRKRVKAVFLPSGDVISVRAR